MSQVGPRVAGGKGNLRDRNLWPSGAWYHSLRSKTCPVFNSHSSELLDSLAILGPCLQPETAFSCSKCTFTEMTAQLLTHTGLLLSVACIPWCGQTISSFVRFEIKIHSARKYFRFFPLGGGESASAPCANETHICPSSPCQAETGFLKTLVVVGKNFSLARTPGTW